MRKNIRFFLFLFGVALLAGCARPRALSREMPFSQAITVYQDESIPAGQGVSRLEGIRVEGYHYANIFVEFEQKSADEKPLSIGVVFYHARDGLGAKRLFEPDHLEHPIYLEASGNHSWHGEQWGKSSYILRVPVAGSFLKVFPTNHHHQARKFSVIVYLTK